MSEIVKHQQQGVSLRAFSEQTGIREGQLLHYARIGRILGARKHPLTKKWWIYPPAKLLFPDSSYTPRSKAPEPGKAAYEKRAVYRASHPASAVDLGTSPHGLPVGLPLSVQETGKASALPLSGRPFSSGELPDLLAVPEDLDELPDWVSPGALPDVFAAPELQATMRGIKREAGEAHYPLVLSGSQMQLMERALSLAIDEAIEAMSDEPTGRHEIKPCLDACNQLYRTLKAAKAAHKNVGDNWRGREL